MKRQVILSLLLFFLLVFLSSFSLALAERNPDLAIMTQNQEPMENQQLSLEDQQLFPQDQQLLIGSQGTPDELVLGNEFFQGIVNTVTPLITKLSLLVGGLFGIYLLLLIVRVYYERKNLKLLQDIRFLLDQQNKQLHLPTSHARRPWIARLLDWFVDWIRLSLFKVFRIKTQGKTMMKTGKKMRA